MEIENNLQTLKLITNQNSEKIINVDNYDYIYQRLENKLNDTTIVPKGIPAFSFTRIEYDIGKRVLPSKIYKNANLSKYITETNFYNAFNYCLFEEEE